jgi:streptomycin 6-kinase
LTRPADQTSRLRAVLDRWDASDPATVAVTPTSAVYRVRLADGSSAIVKDLWPIGMEDELRGADLLQWREGAGYVKLLGREGTTLLLEDAGEYSLRQHLNEYGDASATLVAAEALTAMHAAPAGPPPATLQPLRAWFGSLFAMASTGTNALVAEAAAVADALLDDQRDVRPLHGDLHHENLWLAERGWLAIDPKGLIGDPAYDIANMFYNPLDRDDLRTDPVRIGSMARVFARALGRDAATVLRWAFVHACLSASWHLEDGNAATADSSLGVAAAVRVVIGR